MKKSLLIAYMFILSSVAFAQLPAANEIGAKMYPGWNLGNTLEAGDNNHMFQTDANGYLNYETYWQSTKTTQKIIDYVRELGFRSVRIPCAWMMGHVNNETDVLIDDKWMNRVREIVDYCINSGLYVVLNDHWDGGWLENNLASYKDETARQLKCLWTQIAEAFIDYDEHLLFAGFNEPNCNVNNNPDANHIEALMKYEQDFVDAVRATGGNNSSRTLVVQAPSTSIEHACKYMTMPVDVIEGRMMVEVHYYTPPPFTGVWENGAPLYFWGKDNHVNSGSYSKYNCTWGEEDYLSEQTLMMKKNYADKGYPIILGEYGANWRKLDNQAAQRKHDASIRLFNKLVCQYSVNCGMIPFVWDINSCNQNGSNGIMTVIDRYNCKVFCQPALDGILEGSASGVWPTISGIRNIEQDDNTPDFGSDSSFSLIGTRISKFHDGVVISQGKKYLIKK